MGGVQEPLFDKALLDGQGSPKVQYSARRPLATQKLRKIYEKFVRKSGRQSPEKKTACDKRDSCETNPALLALAVPEVGIFTEKISRRNRVAPLQLNSSEKIGPSPAAIAQTHWTNTATQGIPGGRLKKLFRLR
jgi:hypothetical protein